MTVARIRSERPAEQILSDDAASYNDAQDRSGRGVRRGGAPRPSPTTPVPLIVSVHGRSGMRSRRRREPRDGLTYTPGADRSAHDPRQPVRAARRSRPGKTPPTQRPGESDQDPPGAHLPAPSSTLELEERSSPASSAGDLPRPSMARGDPGPAGHPVLCACPYRRSAALGRVDRRHRRRRDRGRPARHRPRPEGDARPGRRGQIRSVDTSRRTRTPIRAVAPPRGPRRWSSPTSPASKRPATSTRCIDRSGPGRCAGSARVVGRERSPTRWPTRRPAPTAFVTQQRIRREPRRLPRRTTRSRSSPTATGRLRRWRRALDLGLDPATPAMNDDERLPGALRRELRGLSGGAGPSASPPR